MYLCSRIMCVCVCVLCETGHMSGGHAFYTYKDSANLAGKWIGRWNFHGYASLTLRGDGLWIL